MIYIYNIYIQYILYIVMISTKHPLLILNGFIQLVWCFNLFLLLFFGVLVGHDFASNTIAVLLEGRGILTNFAFQAWKDFTQLFLIFFPAGKAEGGPPVAESNVGPFIKSSIFGEKKHFKKSNLWGNGRMASSTILISAMKKPGLFRAYRGFHYPVLWNFSKKSL